MFRLASILSFTLAGLISAQNIIDVQVGATASTEGGIFQFIPNNVPAKKGDIVRFRFSGAPGNHSVTQSSLAKPCDLLSGGFDSGWVLIPNTNAANPAPEWNLTITDDSKPLWFYCKQLQPAPHCGVGMVGAINANDTAMSTFKNNAQGNTNPGQSIGGLVGQGASASAVPGPLNNGAAIFGAPTATASATTAASTTASATTVTVVTSTSLSGVTATSGSGSASSVSQTESVTSPAPTPSPSATNTSGPDSDTSSTTSPSQSDDSSNNGALQLYGSRLAVALAAVMGMSLA